MKSRFWIAIAACACLSAMPGLARAEVVLSPMASSPLADTGQGGMIRAVDLNGDGRDDLAIGSATAATGGVRIRLANADGTWATKPTLLPGDTIGDIVPADFNDDGKTDLLVQIWSSNPSVSDQFQFLPGKGDGTFADANPLTVPGSSQVNTPVTGQAIFPSDLNEDGDLDIFIAALGGKVGGAVGRGDGTFTDVSLTAVSSWGAPTGADEGFGSVVQGDFDGNGSVDTTLGLVGGATSSTDQDSGFFVLYSGSDAPSNIPLHVPLPSPYGAIFNMLADDFNGDGFDDLIVSVLSDDGNSTRFLFYPGGEHGFSTAPTTLFTLPLAAPRVFSDDFDGDGDSDLAWIEHVANSSSPDQNKLVVALGNGAGGFSSQSRNFDLNFDSSRKTYSSATPGDFNGDGAPDFATSFYSDDCATTACGTSVLLNRPDPAASPASIDFGTVTQTAERPSRPLTISNSGGAPMKINQLLGATNLDLTGNCTAIEPGGSCQFQVLLDASVVGEIESSVQIAVSGTDRIVVPVKGNVVAPPPPPLTYKASMKLTGPKKVKAGKKFKLNATLTNTGTGALSGLTLKYTAAQGKKVQAKGQVALGSIAAGKKLVKAFAVTTKRRKLVRGKPLKVTASLIRQGKTIASKSFPVKQDFGQVQSGKK